MDETILGTDGSDATNTFSGDSGSGPLLGETGDDTIRAGAGDDQASGGPQDDFIVGGPGTDTISGGNGSDYIKGDGSALNTGSISGATELNGDRLDGGQSNDKVRGGTGDDVVLGGGGDDRVYGGIGDDLIAGNSGDDILRGGRNNYEYTDGETDFDVFVFDLNDGNDKVIDFDDRGFDDRIVLTEGGSYNLAFNASSGNTVLTYGNTTVVFYDAVVTDSDISVIDRGNTEGMTNSDIAAIISADPLLL